MLADEQTHDRNGEQRHDRCQNHAGRGKLDIAFVFFRDKNYHASGRERKHDDKQGKNQRIKRQQVNQKTGKNRDDKHFDQGKSVELDILENFGKWAGGKGTADKYHGQWDTRISHVSDKLLHIFRQRDIKDKKDDCNQ